MCAFAPQSPQSPPSPEQTVEKLHGVGLCTTTGRFGGCGAQPLHRLGSRTRQIGRVRTRPDGRLRPDASNKECASIFVENGQFSNKGVRLNFSNFRKFSSEIASFQIGSAPQFHRFSQIFVETCQFSNKECASVSLIFTNFRRKLPVFK